MSIFLGCDVSCWQIWSSIAAVIASITTVVGILAIFLTLRATKNQLSEMTKSRALSAFFEAYKLFDIEDDGELFKFVYELKGTPGQLSEVEQQKLEKCLRHVNIVAYLAKEGFFPLENLLHLYFTRIIKVWQKTKPFIDFERNRRNDPTWLFSVEWLAEQSEMYRIKHYPELNLVIYPNSTRKSKESKRKS
jgi:hypothetical protein